MKRKPCVMWTVGPRIHGKAVSCGKAATRGALPPPTSDIPLLPICDECIENTNWPRNLLRPL